MASTKISLGRQTDLNAASQKITSMADGTNPTDAVTLQQLQNFINGADWKLSVRAATTTNGTLASSFANGSTIDGVTLVTGDRILIKDQTTGQDNGIYVVAASGAPTRATDADASSEVTANLAVFVEEGTTNADTGWTISTNGAIVLGTTPLVFTQFTGVGSLVAGAGLTKTGNTIDVVSANGGIVVNSNDITLTAADASLTINSSGIKVTPGTGGQIGVTNGSGVVTPTSLGGDVSTVSNTGNVTMGTTIMRTAGFIDRETPSGSVNSSNVTFTLANTPIAGSESLFLNGLLQDPGAGNDYTISGATITYLTAPVTGDKIRANYRK